MPDLRSSSRISRTLRTPLRRRRVQSSWAPRWPQPQVNNWWRRRCDSTLNWKQLRHSVSNSKKHQEPSQAFYCIWCGNWSSKWSARNRCSSAALKITPSDARRMEQIGINWNKHKQICLALSSAAPCSFHENFWDTFGHVSEKPLILWNPVLY